MLLQGVMLFQGVSRYFKVTHAASVCFMLVQGVSRCLRCFRVFQCFSRCFKMLLNVSSTFMLFKGVSRCFKVIHAVSRYFVLS